MYLFHILCQLRINPRRLMVFFNNILTLNNTTFCLVDFLKFYCFFLIFHISLLTLLAYDVMAFMTSLYGSYNTSALVLLYFISNFSLIWNFWSPRLLSTVNIVHMFIISVLTPDAGAYC